MEREVLLTGIGGQGVQLAAQVLARAATLEGREVMLFGIYGGMMRGGSTDGTVVVADAPITAPPVVSRAWSAIALHDEHWEPVERRLRPGGVVLVNDSTFTSPVRDDVTVHRIGATELAAAHGTTMGASMAMIGAYAALTGLVSLDGALAAMRASIPPYRRQHVAANEAILRAGYESAGHDAVTPALHPAWPAAVPS
jgi:Pyruvate/2-oxoacid:ferredoxin oxidoreductase gamma subunit